MKKRQPGPKTALTRMHVLALLTLSLLLSGCTGVLSGGGTWQQSTLPAHDVRALEVDPGNPLHLYAGDVQGHIFVTTNGGQQWSERDQGLLSPNTLYALAFSPDGNALYAASEQGLFVSRDAAAHWQQVAGLPPGGITALTFVPGHILAAPAHGGVLIRNEQGTAWDAAATLATVVVHGLSYDVDTHQLWAATSMGVYRSDDQGSSWRALSSGLPAGVAINAVVPASSGGGAQGLIFAGTAHGFFRSSDDGLHWTPSHDSLARVSVQAIQVDVRSTNATTIYLGTSVGALRSSDNGDHWGGLASGISTGTAVFKLVIGGDSNSQLYAATATGLYLYPGSGGNGFDPTRLLAIGLVVLIFLGLYLLTRRGRNRRRELLKPERILEQPSVEPAEEA